jgi:hypothetical protein
MLDVTYIKICEADTYFHGFRLRRGHIYGNSHKHGFFVTSLAPSKRDGYFCAYLCARNSREWKKAILSKNTDIIIASLTQKRLYNPPTVGELSRFHATESDYKREQADRREFERNNSIADMVPVFKRSSAEYFGEGKIPYGSQPTKYTFLETYDGYKEIQSAGHSYDAKTGPAELLANNGVTPYDAPKPIKYGEPAYAHNSK